MQTKIEKQLKAREKLIGQYRQEEKINPLGYRATMLSIQIKNLNTKLGLSDYYPFHQEETDDDF